MDEDKQNGTDDKWHGFDKNAIAQVQDAGGDVKPPEPFHVLHAHRKQANAKCQVTERLDHQINNSMRMLART